MYYPAYPGYRQQSADQQILNDLQKAINGEYSAINCYDKLIKSAPNAKQRERITEIRQDEIRHFRTFSNLYMQMTGRQPSPQQTEQCPDNHRAGLIAAFEDEQKTVDLYNEIADRASSPMVRQAFRRAALDEQNHAVWFLSMLTLSR